MIFEYRFSRNLITTSQQPYQYNPTMANRFEYNFTRQSQYEQLREKVAQLQQENSMLKQSLEELIKVNTELTESIEELTSTHNINQNHEEIQAKFQMLINENHNLRQELQHQKQQSKNYRQGSKNDDEDQTESLVNVLEELIQSFKNIQLKYESEIKDLEERLKQHTFQFEQKIKKVEEELESKIGTIQAISTQLKHKDQALVHIMNKFNQLEKQIIHVNSSMKMMKPQNSEEIKTLDKKIQKLSKDLEEKDRAMHLYQGLFMTLKSKIMEKM